MSEYIVSNEREIDLRVEGINKILQNVRNILATIRGELPLRRDFGLNPDLIDRPINLVKTSLISDIISQIDKWEKRVKVKEVRFDNDTDGKLLIYVKVEVKNE